MVMNVDTTILRQKLNEQRELLAFWQAERDANPTGIYTRTIGEIEKRIIELQAQLTVSER